MFIEGVREGLRNPSRQRARQDLREVVASYPDKIASRRGDRVQFIEPARVTHFLAKDKLSYAVTSDKRYVVEMNASWNQLARMPALPGGRTTNSVRYCAESLRMVKMSREEFE